MRKRDAVLGAAALTALGTAGAMKLNDILFRPMVPPPVEVDLPCRRLSIPSGDALLSGALLGEEGPRGRLILAHGMGVSWDYYPATPIIFPSKNWKGFTEETNTSIIRFVFSSMTPFIT